ncbi:MAG TPA: O-antigen ligase family protein [Pseudobdellovibrionaceae bacterium]|nr:O-antigen ligase family protein [Pseudobdellovibrionaceae bacterium]
MIAAAIFFAWEKTNRPLKAIIIGLLFIGLILTRSRGTIGLVIITLMWTRIPKWALWGLISTMSALVMLNWERFAGRIQLWYISAIAILDSPIFGHGVGSFDSVYFNKNLEIMSHDAKFRNLFGPWSSQVSDAHNLILHWGVEYGILGAIVATGIILAVLFKLKFITASDGHLARLIVLKSLYTVVLISIQSLVLFAFAIGNRSLDQSKSPKFNLGRMLIALFLIVAATHTLRVSMTTGLSLQASLRLLQIGIPELSLRRTKDILNQNPKDTNALLATSYAYLKMRQCSHSSYFALRATHVRQNMDVYKRASHILFECRYFEESLELFDRLHVVFPEHRTTTMKIAWANFFLGNFEIARQMAQNVIEISPRRVSYSDERNLREARDLLKRIAQISDN